MKQKEYGFTLIELLIYIVITAIVATIAGSAWYNSTVFSLSSKKKAALQSLMNDVGDVIERDFHRIGASAYLADSGSLVWDNSAMMDSSTTQSFTFTDNDSMDAIQFMTLRMDDGLSVGVEVVEYEVRNNELFRSLVFTPNALGTSKSIGAEKDTVSLAKDIIKFDLKFGVHGRQAVLGDSIIASTNIDSSNFNKIEVGVSGSASWSTPATYVKNGLIIGDSVVGFDSLNVASLEGFLDSTSYIVRLEKLLETSQIKRGSRYSLFFYMAFNNDFIDNYNLVDDTLSVVLWDDANDRVLAGTPIYRFSPTSAGSYARYSFDFNPSENSVQVHPRVLLNLGKVYSGTPALQISDFDIELVSEGMLGNAWASSTMDTSKAFESINTKSIRLSVGLKDMLGKDSILHESWKIIDLLNNGVRL